MSCDTPKITLKAARVNAGFTQEEVAALLGVSARQIWIWEKYPGDIKQKYVKKLAEIYDYPKDLINFEA